MNKQQQQQLQQHLQQQLHRFIKQTNNNHTQLNQLKSAISQLEHECKQNGAFDKINNHTTEIINNNIQRIKAIAMKHDVDITPTKHDTDIATTKHYNIQPILDELNTHTPNLLTQLMHLILQRQPNSKMVDQLIDSMTHNPDHWHFDKQHLWYNKNNNTTKPNNQILLEISHGKKHLHFTNTQTNTPLKKHEKHALWNTITTIINKDDPLKLF